MEIPEVDEGVGYAGFEEARALILGNTAPVATEELPLASCPGHVSAEDVFAVVDSPSNDSSLKDGFAVRSDDVLGTSDRHSARLILVGSVFAGDGVSRQLLPGQTMKVLTGAPIPHQADAVVSSEFCEEDGETVWFRAGASKGKNVMVAGEDVRIGMTVIAEGQVLSPARLAFAAVAGIARLKVHRKPTVGILSVGDELVTPGNTLKRGSIYASNSVNIGAWLSLLGVPFLTSTVGDDAGAIESSLIDLERQTDAIITNGGLMNSERDLMLGVLEALDCANLFRHVRMGPGKGTSFGIWRGKPVFCLSGSPTSSLTGFLQLVLPGICNMVGLRHGLPTASARLTRPVRGRNKAWTEFRQARLERDVHGTLTVVPLSDGSRSRSMADADCLLCKPEGVESLYPDQMVTVHLMDPALLWANRVPFML